MTDVLDLADRLWTGAVTVDDHHPLGTGRGELVEVADGVRFWHGFSNATVVDTAAGLVMVDSGDPVFGPLLYEQVRGWRPEQPLRDVVFSHGHIDHVFGVGPFDGEAGERGWPRPVVHAQESLPARFDRYRLTAGYNATVNRRQFGIDDLQWPTEYRYPDDTYRGTTTLDVGERVELHAARGETDDHTWTWFAERRVLCCGDLFIWATPNAGNPQKVQRYAAEWAVALGEMAGLGADVLLPGHGVPVVGADRVRQALTDTAYFLQSLHDQTLALMNSGARLDEILHSVAPPAELADRPYLQPVYDEPEFVVRNVWRLYGGWWDGNPATLKPAAEATLAHEVVDLAGAEVLIERATALLERGDDEALRLAAHLAEWLTLDRPDSARAHELRADVYAARVTAERSTMAKGVFGWAVRESVR
ncbi:MAG TPA: alkyl sulfatase dimerization domain-containing protein [Mycobacteriales bacterium]|nr:alkyl sulfatase dimerization domain-containing protein [Mycobacteriales bacterium]